jgi:Spy/CpxP family protein refolding chaperone
MVEITPGMRVATALLVGVVSAVGCGAHKAASPPPATAATADDAENAGLREHHRYHHHGGTTLFIAMSLETLGVSPEQRVVVEKIRDGLRANMEAARAAEDELVATLADGLVASAFDGAKVDAAVVKVTAAAAQVNDVSADALNDLHAVLTPPQRAALVDKVEAHWAVWRKVNSDEPAAGERGGGHLATFETELALTPDQMTKIRAALADDLKSVPPFEHEKVTAHVRAFGAAFRGESFDAKSMSMKTGRAADEQLVRWGAVHLVHVVESVSPILTADQRNALADELHLHATHAGASS